MAKNNRVVGAETRFDADFGGNHFERERLKVAKTGVYIAFQKRFCECCKTSKPKSKRPALKGWVCNDCLARRPMVGLAS